MSCQSCRSRDRCVAVSRGVTARGRVKGCTQAPAMLPLGNCPYWQVSWDTPEAQQECLPRIEAFAALTV